MMKPKRCPFCGDRVVVSWFHGSYHVFCTKCGVIVRMPLSSTKEENCIATWNTRKPVDDVLERLKKEENDLFSARKALSLKMYSDFEILEKSKMLLEKELTLFKVIEIIKEELGGMTDV